MKQILSSIFPHYLHRHLILAAAALPSAELGHTYYYSFKVGMKQPGQASHLVHVAPVTSFSNSLIFVTIRKPNFVFTASSHELAFYGTLASHCCFVISTFFTFFPKITALVRDLSVFQYIKLLFMLLLSPQSPLFWFVVF